MSALAESGIEICPTLGTTLGVEMPPEIDAMLRNAGLTMEQGARACAELDRRGVRIVSGSDGGIGAAKGHASSRNR